MPLPARFLVLPLLLGLAACVPPEYRKAEDRSAHAGETPDILPLRELYAEVPEDADAIAETAAALDSRNAALSQRRGPLAAASASDRTELENRAEALRLRAEDLRSRE
ncbi:hypothetical protein [Poseidonocella sp. HB161398]|uniref:hypothetical protein n=1 Tax=Poseidonocella sp. HB161398 TaxID=2320855 RepID=UPI0011095ACE|nr:hypothetical protein [Poseidonocella sp. HB161398]